MVYITWDIQVFSGQAARRTAEGVNEQRGWTRRTTLECKVYWSGRKQIAATDTSFKQGKCLQLKQETVEHNYLAV